MSAPTPITADGKPDLSGIWLLRASGSLAFSTDDMKPWAQALVKQRRESWQKDDPIAFRCLPRGPAAFLGALPGGETHIMQTQGLIAVLYADLAYRRIFMDGRVLPKDPNPDFMGYSVGRSEGDTLVVESIGFNDSTTLGDGVPHTEALRITERYHRTDFGHMELQVSLEDPGTFSSMLTLPVKAVLMADTDMLEYVCNDNEKDNAHITGKTTDDAKFAVRVAPAVLAQYAGTYELTFPFPVVLNVSVSGDQLLISGKLQFPYQILYFHGTGSASNSSRTRKAKFLI